MARSSWSGGSGPCYNGQSAARENHMMDVPQPGSDATPILYCRCAYAQIVPAAVKDEVLRHLHESGAAFNAVPDLCALAATRNPLLPRLAAGGRLKIAACFPRAVRWLFARAGAPLPMEGVEILNMRTATADDVVAGLLGPDRVRGGTDPAAQSEMVAAVRAAGQAGPQDGWKPWFPVIDGERCANCKQCLSFCLFGVYGLSEQGRVEVQRPRNCKTDCPACARVCPEAAIIFPKYGAAPINGDQVRPEDLRRESMGVEVSARLGGNTYQTLRDRTAQAKTRFSPQQDDARALEERRRCLEKFQGAHGTPAGEPPSPSAQ